MSCLNPIIINRVVHVGEKEIEVPTKVPCGKCLGCLRRRRASWSFRLYHEFLSSVSAWFVTLTYDNDHLPLEGVNKRDIQLFLKRFRKKRKCRYFLTSEYGENFTHRPHYHCLMFFPEMVELTEVVKDVDSSWQNGNIQVGNVTLASINYCSKYSLKPRIDENGIFPNKTFSMMSRKPGIGADWLTDRNKKIHREDLDSTCNLNGLTYSLPRYYQDKIFNKIDKLKINSKIQLLYGNKEEQFHGREWLEAVRAAEKRSYK